MFGYCVCGWFPAWEADVCFHIRESLLCVAPQMQQQELAQMRQRDANLTALAAIGPRKKRKLDSPGGTTAGAEVGSSRTIRRATVSGWRRQIKAVPSRCRITDGLVYSQGFLVYKRRDINKVPKCFRLSRIVRVWTVFRGLAIWKI